MIKRTFLQQYLIIIIAFLITLIMLQLLVADYVKEADVGISFFQAFNHPIKSLKYTLKYKFFKGAYIPFDY